MTEVRYVLNRAITAVFHQVRPGAAYRENDKWEVEQIDDGWVVVVEGRSAFPVGDDKPEFKVGDSVRITIEKINSGGEDGKILVPGPKQDGPRETGAARATEPAL